MFMKILKGQKVYFILKVAVIFLLLLMTVFSALIATSFTKAKIADAESEKYILFPYTGELANLSEANPSSYIFSNEAIGEDKGFYVPQTYYAKYISTKQLDVEYYEISYCGITGYIKADSKLQPKEITEVTESNAYPQIYLTLKDGVSFKAAFTAFDENWTFRYLGESINADKVYVSCTKGSENKIAETDKSNFNSYAVPLHSITQAAKAAETKTEITPDGTLTPATTTNKTLRGLLIAGIVFPAVVIIILIFVPRKKKQTYDDFASERRMSPYDRPRNSKRDPYPDRYGKEDYDYDRRRYDRYDDYPPSDRREREIDYDRYDSQKNDRYDERY